MNFQKIRKNSLYSASLSRYFENKIYIVNTEFSSFEDGYTCLEDIKVYPIDHVFCENKIDSDSESESEETSIELQIKMLDIEIQAKMKLREYLQSKLI